MKLRTLFLGILAFGGTSLADEIHSNSLGGGLWSQPNTWTGKKVPAATDIVVISTRDTVVFDQNDDSRISCKSLLVDPNGAFIVQDGFGKRTITVNGPIEAYGTLKMDASAHSTDSMAIRLVSSIPEDRAIRLLRGGSLLALGREDLTENACNVSIQSPPPAAGAPPLPAKISAPQHTMLDLRQTSLANIEVNAVSVDNTGSKPNERLNLVDNRFSGSSHVILYACDTPVVARNTFTSSPDTPVAVAAINAQICPLAEIRDNVIRGPFPIGIQVNGESDATGNTVEKCGTGIYWYGNNAMMKQNIIRDCETGLLLNAVTGSIEDLTIDRCKTGISATGTIAQFSNTAASNVSTNGCALSLENSSLTLLNCNMTPNQIRLGKNPVAKSDLPWVETMQFLVIKAKGALGPKTQVEVTTSPPPPSLPAGASDLNIRNSPAMLRSGGLSPLPQSLTPLILRSWKIGRDGKVQPAPDYTLTFWEPAAREGEKPRTLKTMPLKPDASWFRPKPNDPNQALEVIVP